MHVTVGTTSSFFYSDSAKGSGWARGRQFGVNSCALVFRLMFFVLRASFRPVSLQLRPLRACFETPREREKRFARAPPHLSREAPLRPGFAKDIPPLTGDEVRVRTGRRMFGGKGVVQAAGEPVIGQHSCCVKLIESEWLEPVFLFKYLSINYLCYICFLLYSPFVYERSIYNII